MPQMYERPPIDLKCTIKVRNLCKTFATEKSYEISLDNISVDIFEVIIIKCMKVQWYVRYAYA